MLKHRPHEYIQRDENILAEKMMPTTKNNRTHYTNKTLDDHIIVHFIRRKKNGNLK